MNGCDLCQGRKWCTRRRPGAFAAEVRARVLEIEDTGRLRLDGGGPPLDVRVRGGGTGATREGAAVSGRCRCGARSMTIPERLESRRRKIHASAIERGVIPAGTPLGSFPCSRCALALLKEALDPVNDINAPGGAS